MKILKLLTSDGYFLKKQASTHGGEYAGACPWCGGKDRFRVWPNYKNGRYWCRQCGKNGDCIQYLRDGKGFSYKEACEYLNVQPKYNQTEFIRNNESPVWTPRLTLQPEKAWQKKAKYFLDNTSQNIPKKILGWLYDRGLSKKTIEKYKLRWNLKNLFKERKSWGLAEIISDQTNKPKKLWLPCGLVIPYIADGKIIRLRVRRFSSDNQPYIIVPGSDTRPMILSNDNNKTVVVLESELDALMIHEKAGDIVCVIALGNAQSRPDRITDKILKQAELILLALDYDDAGSKESVNWWPEHYDNIQRWPSAIGKDPGEDYQKGIDIREWIKAGLQEIK